MSEFQGSHASTLAPSSDYYGPKCTIPKLCYINNLV